MSEPNYYETLQVSQSATQAQIKQAYRRLVKQFHPDCNPEGGTQEAIVQINAAYEVLGDRKARQSYDRRAQWRSGSSRRGTTQTREATAAQRTARHVSHNADEQVYFWIQQVYRPLNSEIDSILDNLDDQVDELSADPFDDELMENFSAYISSSRIFLDRAQVMFRSQPNPSSLAGVAADLYHCLNQVGDGLEELEYFTLNYDDRHLHVGQELFRIARGLQEGAFARMQHIL